MAARYLPRLGFVTRLTAGFRNGAGGVEVRASGDFRWASSASQVRQRGTTTYDAAAYCRIPHRGHLSIGMTRCCGPGTPVPSRRTEPALVQIGRVVADVVQTGPESLDASFGQPALERRPEVLIGPEQRAGELPQPHARENAVAA